MKNYFMAWTEGKTGYPIVDAAMRQLKETGWMHNRLRMVAAMFLTKHLFIDWRWGEKYFMEQLIDADFASNMAAGSGVHLLEWMLPHTLEYLIPLGRVSDLIAPVCLFVSMYQNWPV